jgi:hypothetical protein
MTRGLILTHGSDTVDCRSMLIHCHQWNDLLGRPPVHVTVQKLPGLPGGEVGPQSPGWSRGRLEFRLNGGFTANSTPRAGSESDHRDAMLAALDELYAILTVGEEITATVHEDETYEGPIVVVDPDRPTTRGRMGWLVPEIIVPGGRLEVAP